MRSCGASWGRTRGPRRSRRRRTRRLSSRRRGRCVATAGDGPVGSRAIRGRRWLRSPTRTRGCGTTPGHVPAGSADLAGAAQVGLERRQVFDLPPITVRVTEHQLIARRCACGVTTCGQAPAGVSAPVQYGPRITAIVVYLYVGQFLSQKRTATALAELFGTPVGEGTVAAMTARAADGLAGFLSMVGERIAAAPVGAGGGRRVAGQVPRGVREHAAGGGQVAAPVGDEQVHPHRRVAGAFGPGAGAVVDAVEYRPVVVQAGVGAVPVAVAALELLVEVG